MAGSMTKRPKEIEAMPVGAEEHLVAQNAYTAFHTLRHGTFDFSLEILGLRKFRICTLLLPRIADFSRSEDKCLTLLVGSCDLRNHRMFWIGIFKLVQVSAPTARKFPNG
jgi:hypothetical protein